MTDEKGLVCVVKSEKPCVFKSSSVKLGDLIIAQIDTRFREDPFGDAEYIAKKINTALRPLVEKAALADRMAKALREAQRVLSVYVTDDSAIEDKDAADLVDVALAAYDKLKGEK